MLYRLGKKIYETVQNELTCNRMNIKGNLNLQRLPWLLINHKDVSTYIPDHRDISGYIPDHRVICKIYTGCFL